MSKEDKETKVYALGLKDGRSSGRNEALQEIKKLIQDNEKDSWIECGKLLNKIEELKVQDK